MQPRSIIAPAMRFLAGELRGHLDQLPHLVKDSSVFVSRLSREIFSQAVTIMKIDIKEYYMSGTHSVLREQSSKFFHGGQQRRFTRVLNFILGHQCVELPGIPEHLWKVLHGSGMGMICSGEVSDSTFFQLAEEPWINDAAFFRSVGLRCYFRFKDDIIAFFDGPNQQCDRFFTMLSLRAGPFALELERLSHHEATFLDVHLFKKSRTDNTTSFCHSVHEKVTSQWVPLSELSHHPPSVHRAWPVAMALRYGRLCSSPLLARQQANIFISKLRRSGTSSRIIDAIRNAIQQRPSQLLRVPREDGPQGRVVFLVLPFFHQWANAQLNRELHLLNKKWESSVNFTIRLSWRLGDVHLVTKLRSFNADYGENPKDFCPIIGGWLG
eukprot:1227705-Pyramimonas_sp.AAC.1